MLIAFHREPKWLDIIHVKTGDVINLFREFDRWLRRRLRQVRWKEWKRPNTRGRKLRALGLSEADARATAVSQKGYWHLAGTYPPTARDAERLLAPDPGLEGVQRTLWSLPGCSANRPVRTRTPGGVGGARVSLRPYPNSMRGGWRGISPDQPPTPPAGCAPAPRAGAHPNGFPRTLSESVQLRGLS